VPDFLTSCLKRRCKFDQVFSPDIQSLMQVLDQAFLDRQCFGDAGLQQDLISLYKTQLAELSKRIAIAEGDALIRAAHRLRGASLAIGAEEIAATAAQIEAGTLLPPAAGARLAEAARRFSATAR
jgi:HPt (histidine-containing phosphotransfer) domain-containing protein